MMPKMMSQLEWFVAHTRPRCEKRLAAHCARAGVDVTLPCYASVRRYRGKTVTFQKPLFPNYVFMQLDPARKQEVFQSDHVANLLVVHDQQLFEHQLNDILRALETDLEIRLVPEIREGALIRIRSGPLRGLEGVVEKRSGMVDVLLRLDFIGQAAAVRLHAADVELT